MLRRFIFCTLALPLFAVLFSFMTMPCPAEDFTYNNFSRPSQLIFQGDATLTEGRVRLTPAECSQAGALWLSSKQWLEQGFETSFQFQLAQPGVFGANGLAFVIQNNDTPLLGKAGHGMGFRGIPNSLVIKFDPYHFRNHHYVKYDQVAILDNGSSTVYPADAGVIDSSTNITFSDGQVHTAKIVYTPGHLSVFLDDLEHPVLTAFLNLSDVVQLDHDQAWVGFTAATGADFYKQDVIQWSFHSPDEMTQDPTPDTSQPSTQAYLSSQPPQLPSDPSFGYQLPGNADLNFQIQASTDLVHWETLTNAVLYFKDPDSLNYDHRFYRFIKK
jgi:hypothetical protein